MKKVISKIVKTSKILLLLISILLLNSVTFANKDAKIVNESMNKTLDLTAMAIKFNEIQMQDKYYPLDTFTGDLTGYAADCPLCSGYLGCNGQNVKDGTTNYDDVDYGKVNIVASSKNLPCGSIVTFKAPSSNDPITAIVLDRGVLGNDLDLLVKDEDYARQHVGRRKISYDVLRIGWKRETA